MSTRQPDSSAPLPSPERRHFLHTAPALAAALAGSAISPPAHAAAAAPPWCATWGTAPAGPPPASSTLSFSNQTLRLIVHTSIGGSAVRVRLSNEMGSTALRIGAACIGLRSSGAGMLAGSARNLSFGGNPTATIPAGAPLLSDPVDLAVPALADLAISIYLPDSVSATTVHDMALQASYVSSAGNYAATPALPVQATIGCWPFLAEVDVLASAGATALVALGDSITDGARSTGNIDRRWPDWLARRMQQEAPPGTPPLGIVNRGISGNSLLTDYATALISGHDCLERFDRDVLATTGAGWLFVLAGINDIVYSPAANPIPPADLAAGYQQLIARARLRGLRAIGATLTPFEGLSYYNPARENVRQRVNDWIRTGGAWDAVVDFDQVLRDPAQPTRLNPAYDSGDHLHPNDAGYQALAQAVPLSLFTPA
ncbi:MAG: SGNH/GDSL hydrolase family protein [Ramlibacter sp.]